jgi:hypothetical protein
VETSVKKAVYTILASALSPITVHNGAKLDTALPYIDIDDFSETDWGTKDFTGSLSELRIHIWHNDRKACATAMQAIRTALDRVELTLVGENFVDCQFRSGRSFTDADGTTRHGVVDFEVISHN